MKLSRPQPQLRPGHPPLKHLRAILSMDAIGNFKLRWTYSYPVQPSSVPHDREPLAVVTAPNRQFLVPDCKADEEYRLQRESQGTVRCSLRERSEIRVGLPVS